MLGTRRKCTLLNQKFLRTYPCSCIAKTRWTTSVSIFISCLHRETKNISMYLNYINKYSYTCRDIYYLI